MQTDMVKLFVGHCNGVCAVAISCPLVTLLSLGVPRHATNEGYRRIRRSYTVVPGGAQTCKKRRVQEDSVGIRLGQHTNCPPVYQTSHTQYA